MTDAVTTLPPDPDEAPRSRAARIGGLLLALSLFAVVLLAPLGDIPEPARRTLAVTALVASLWLTQAIPIPAASLLPLVLLPALSVASTKKVAALYANDSTFLFLGGFLIAIAIERCGLHRRIALAVVEACGQGPRRLTFAFMGLSAFLSLWISNTATTLMLLPIGLAVIAHVGERMPAADEREQRAFRHFAALVLLGIAYGASIGGVGTPVGTPPNVLLFGQLQASYPERPELHLSFLKWMVAMVPLVLVFAPLAWLLMEKLVLPCAGLVRAFHPDVRKAVATGRLTRDEVVVGGIFALTAILWATRGRIDLGPIAFPGWAALAGLESQVQDATVAMLGALALFFVPSSQRRGQRILDWSVESKVPWGILLLFGGGFAIAGAFEESGLAAWFGATFAAHLPGSPVATASLTCVLVTLLSEFANNTATAAVLLPVAAGLADATAVHPFTFMLPVTIAASCGFMLPVATAPNAIVFASGKVSVGQMAKAGVLLDIAGVVLITIFVRTWWAYLFGL